LLNAIGSSRFNDFMDDARSGQPFLDQPGNELNTGFLRSSVVPLSRASAAIQDPVISPTEATGWARQQPNVFGPLGGLMRTTLELPDPLFARLKARAASEQLTLKQLLRRLRGAWP
jgi:hypothetical protein